MKIRIQLFCFIALASCLQIMAENEFFSCSIWPRPILSVTFDCTFLDSEILHRNYFDKHVVNDICPASLSFHKENNATIFSSAPVITLKNCRLPIMPQEFLQRIGSVKEMNFYGSGIKSINNATFSTGCSLERLSLSQNDLTELPGFLFSNTPNISLINLSRNRISNIDPNTFGGSANKLKEINLSYNHIETIDKLLFVDLKSLEILFLGHNFIEHFQADLFALKDLTVLGVDNNKIARIDCTNFALSTNKIFIDLNTNYIQEIDLNCDGHIDTLVINIADNQLTSLTFPKLNLMNGLTKITASRNLLETVTFIHRSFLQLEVLHLNENNLKELVAEWDETMFPKLRWLDISGNQFNCSYLSAFLKKLLMTIGLERENLRSYWDDKRKKSKTIRGITCVDEVKNVFQSDSDGDALHSIKYLLAFLCIAVAILWGLKLVKIVKKIRHNFYHRDSSQFDCVNL